MSPWRMSAALAAVIGLFAGAAAQAADAHHYSFAYDQPHTTGYGIAGDIFNAKLERAQPWRDGRSTSSPARSSGRSRRCCRKSAPATSIS